MTLIIICSKYFLITSICELISVIYSKPQENNSSILLCLVKYIDDRNINNGSKRIYNRKI